MKNKIYKMKRIRKLLRKMLHLSDNELTSYLITKHNLDHYPTREEIINLEKLFLI